MIALFKGLGLLLQDNELYRAPFEKQLAHWKAKSEAQLHEEVELLARAKCQWLIASIVLWQASALLILGLILCGLAIRARQQLLVETQVAVAPEGEDLTIAEGYRNRATCTGHQLFTGIDTIAFD